MTGLSHNFLVTHSNTPDLQKDDFLNSCVILLSKFNQQQTYCWHSSTTLKSTQKSNRKRAGTPEIHKIIGKREMLFWTQSMSKNVFWNYVRKEEVLQVKLTVALEHFTWMLSPVFCWLYSGLQHLPLPLQTSKLEFHLPEFKKLKFTSHWHGTTFSGTKVNKGIHTHKTKSPHGF